jgi:protein-disulfide isomerase
MRSRALAIASLLVVLGGACARPTEDGRVTAAAEASRGVVYRVPVDGAPSIGDERAPVTLVGFSDYECPFCARVDATVAELRKQYGARLRVVMRQRPLPIHPHARAAALAALAADAQGKFWPMHERLFASSRSLDEASLVDLARASGLDVARWQADRGRVTAAVDRDGAIATTLGVVGTPTFFVNGRRIVGAQPIDQWKQTIDAELAAADALVARGVRPADVYATIMKDAIAEAPAPAKPLAKLAANNPTKAADAPGAAAAPSPECDAPDGNCGCTAHDEEPETTRIEDVPVGGAPVRGPERAPVTVVVFSDFECPFCLRSEATLRALAAQYPDKVRIAFRNTPLPMHPNAPGAARAALAAGEQGKFWEYHDALFAHQSALDPASLDRYATDLGLDLARFHRVMASSAVDATLAADAAEAARLGVAGTPTSFVNGRRLIGAQPLPTFQASVDAALREAAR